MTVTDVFAWIVAGAITPWAGAARPGEKMFWLHLLGSLLLAAAVQRRAGLGFRSLFPKAIWAHPSARVDVRWYFVNGALTAVILLPVVASQRAIGTWVAGHLAGAWGAREAVEPGVGVSAALALAAALVADFAIYLPHWLQHRLPLLWEFHKVHHSAEVLTPFTAYRFHPVDDVLNAASVAVLVGVLDGVLFWAFPAERAQMTILRTNAALFLFYALGVHLRHSHVWLAYPRIVSQVLISPAMHQVHHSMDPAHHGKNLGLVFSVWDRLFGTLYVPEKRVELAFGLGEGESAPFSGVGPLYRLPFRNAWRRLRSRSGQVPAATEEGRHWRTSPPDKG